MTTSTTADPWAELHAMDLDEMQTVFPEDTIAKDAAVGLDEGRGIRTQGTHTAEDASRVRKAVDAIERLPAAGEAIHLLLSGSYRNSDFIPAILDMAGERCDDLSVCTLGYDRHSVDMLLRELDENRIRRLSMLSCVYAESHFPELHQWLTAELARRGSRHLAARVHVKVMAFDFQDGRRITVESSANLRSCRMAELTTITADEALTAFHHGWIAELFRKAHQ